jgi:hypothetical protein
MGIWGEKSIFSKTKNMLETKQCINNQVSVYFYLGSPPSGRGDRSHFWLSCLGPLNYLAFQSFDFERTVKPV